MSFEGRSRLNEMLGGTSDASAAAELVGKQAGTDDEGGYGESDPQKKEGGEGEKKPGTPAGPASGEKKGDKKGGEALSIKVTTKPAPGDPSTERKLIGVGEKVTFEAPEEGTWKADMGDIGTGKSVEWSMPRATMANIVFEPFLNSPNANQRGSTIIQVAQPRSITFKKTGDVPRSGPGLAGVGMDLELKFGPDTVSFEGVEWSEQSGPASGVTGYFAEYVKQGKGDLHHHPNKNWLPMDAANGGIIDHAFTKDKPKLMHPTEGKERWWAGAYQWQIHNHFRVAGGAAQLIETVTQRFEMDDAGAVTVTKGGASATSRPDNNMDGDIQKYPTLAAAQSFLREHGRAGCIQAVANYQRNAKVDKASLDNMIQALKLENVELYTFVDCLNTYAWTSADKVKLSANGKESPSGQKNINTGKGAEFLFSANDFLDYNNLLSPIVFTGNMEGHFLMAVMPFPFARLDNHKMNDRYQLTAYLR